MGFKQTLEILLCRYRSLKAHCVLFSDIWWRNSLRDGASIFPLHKLYPTKSASTTTFRLKTLADFRKYLPIVNMSLLCIFYLFSTNSHFLMPKSNELNSTLLPFSNVTRIVLCDILILYVVVFVVSGVRRTPSDNWVK